MRLGFGGSAETSKTCWNLDCRGILRARVDSSGPRLIQFEVRRKVMTSLDLSTTHTRDTANPQSYWQHMRVALVGSLRLIALGFGGVWHAFFPEHRRFQFWTSSGVIRIYRPVDNGLLAFPALNDFRNGLLAAQPAGTAFRACQSRLAVQRRDYLPLCRSM